MSSSGTRRKEDVPLDADGNAIVDGLLTPTPDSPADSEWRSRAGPLDVNDGGGPWKQEDSSGRWFPCRIRERVFFSFSSPKIAVECLGERRAGFCLEF